MGIDYDGNMIVGEKVSKCSFPDDMDECEILDWINDNDMWDMSPWFDCDLDERTIGFKVDNIPVEEMNEIWLNGIREKANKFEELTGVKARLIGMQNIW